jgi:plastocyanin
MRNRSTWALSIAAAAALLSTSTARAQGTTHVVTQAGFNFSPSSLTISAGDTVEWVWGNGNHTVTSGTACTSSGLFDLPLSAANPKATFTFNSAGAYDYFCVPHCGLGMTGVITVQAAGPVNYCTAGSSAAGCKATLSATGTPSATASSGFDLMAAGVEGQKNGIFFYGTNGRQANPWGNGTSFQCVVPPVKRGGLLSGTGTSGACDGLFAQDLNARWCPTCPKPGHNPGAGTVVQAQLWYRDPLNTSNQTTSLSDALEFTVAP